MVITHVQDVASENANPMVNVQFGPFGKLAGTAGEFGYGTMQVFKGGFQCVDQTLSAPFFYGTVNDKLTGFFIDPIFKGAPISFHVLGMNMNLDMKLKTPKVENMDLKISAVLVGFPVRCMDNDTAEKEFAENANKAIEDMINKASDNEALKAIAPLLN